MQAFCGVVLVVSCVVCCVVLFLLCVCVCDLFLFLHTTGSLFFARSFGYVSCQPPALNATSLFTDGLYTKGTRAHTQRELIWGELVERGRIRSSPIHTCFASHSTGPFLDARSPGCAVCQPQPPNSTFLFTDGLYTKGTRAHTHRELIREWLPYSHLFLFTPCRPLLLRVLIRLRVASTASAKLRQTHAVSRVYGLTLT